jgi:hypothetical protein
MKRLKLIWYALTAPKQAIEERTAQIEFELDQVFIQEIQKHLNAIEPHKWDLVGIHLEHTSEVNIKKIEGFLVDAPYIVQRLIDTMRRFK